MELELCIIYDKKGKLFKDCTRDLKDFLNELSKFECIWIKNVILIENRFLFYIQTRNDEAMNMSLGIMVVDI